MKQITKITQKEAELTAKLYIASLFALSDDFNTNTRNGDVDEFTSNEVNNKVQKEIDKQVAKLLKNIAIDTLPTTSYSSITKAKELVNLSKKIC